MSYRSVITARAVTASFAFGLVCLTGGCAVAPAESTEEAEIVGAAASEINDGINPQPWMWQRTVKLKNCTGVIIGSRHVLTAAHCKPLDGDTVYFYNGLYPTAGSRTIVDVDWPSGVDPYAGDLNDSNGKFADMAVVKLSSSIPSTSVPAKLAYDYPGSGVNGVQAGAGSHDGASNPNGLLLYRIGETYSSSVGNGDFLLTDHETNGGDSGSGFFASTVLQGVNHGSTFDWVFRNQYASVSYRLSWILGKIAYPNNYTVTTNKIVSGTTLESFGTYDVKICRLACDQDSSCDAYNLMPQIFPGGPSTCSLVANPTSSTVTLTGAQFGLK